MPTTPQLPPLPEPDVMCDCGGDYFTVPTLRARDRQIVELCASFAEDTEAGDGSHDYNAGAETMAENIAARLRALLGDKGEK